MNLQRQVIDAELRCVFSEACQPEFAATHLREGVIRDIYATNKIDFSSWLPESFLNAVSKANINGGIISGLAWKDPSLQEMNNLAIDDIIQRSHIPMKGFFMPAFQKNEVDWFREASEVNRDKYVGFEVIPKWHGVGLESQKLNKLIRLAIDMNVYVKVYTCHITQPFQGNNAIETFKMIFEYPDAKFIIPHLGGLLPFYQLDSRYRKRLSECLFLGSVSSTMKMCQYCMDINSSNILFASDYPFNHCCSITEVVDSVKGLDLSEPQRNAFFYSNAKRAFDMQ